MKRNEKFYSYCFVGKFVKTKIYMYTYIYYYKSKRTNNYVGIWKIWFEIKNYIKLDDRNKR